MTLPIRPTIRLSSPGDLAIAIPMLLGYHPEESLVVSCLRGAAVDLTMRFDLAHIPPAEEFACELADRIEQAKADLTIVAVFTDQRPVDGELPFAEVIDELYGDERLRVVEAVLVSDRRWWSYLCADPVCCPPAGRPLDASSDVATSLSAAFAINGSGVLADREALVASLAFDPSVGADAADRRVRSAAKRAIAKEPAQLRTEIATLVDTLVERFEDPRAELTDAEVASLAGLIHDVTARDEVLIQAVPPRRREAILRVLRVAVRRVPPPHDAPLCTALAWFAYADGDGTTANIALDRALRSDPEYSLALLIEASLERQLPPDALVEVMKGAARDLDARDAAG
ncbi:MAG TPA: DUF4192 domain-containing protein [Mycobacteriales bacterium]|nr:DUF4192 domain-containing protein [Mycobacteriales bacterium]